MASLRDIRKRISSVKSTQQVTRAMKMVAAAKLRKAQERTFEMRAYAYKIGEIISHLKQHIDPTAHPLFKPRDEVNGVLLIIVTADRGLAGAFNANIIKLAEQTIAERYQRYQEAGTLHLICVGRKAHEHFKRRNFQLVGDFRGVFNDLDYEDASRITNTAVNGYEEGRWDEVHVVYNEFKNTISQNRIVEPVLPIPPEQFRTPVMEKEVEHVATKKEGQSVDYIFEPEPISILHVLVPRFLHFTIWRALLESNAAEQGARMVAMDNATSNAEDLLRDLQLKYNRARQDAITKELIEITSGADALASA
ncbi:MAG: ATP synthase F1 subunit gamma [Rhodothermales bacterium]